MTNLERSKFGFWYSVGHQTCWQLTGVEGIVAFFLGTGGSIALVQVTTTAARVAIAADFLALAAGLLGIVLAAFALVIAFLSDSYISQLQKNPKGIRAFFDPFMINVGTDVGLVIGTVAYRAAAPHLQHMVEKISFVVLATLFVYAVLNITALARGVLAHGVTRAELIELEELEARENGAGPAAKRRQIGSGS
jgi:hypothetical protein